MGRRTILILEDDEDRVDGFRSAVASLGHEFSVRFWRDAPTMIAESPAWLVEACLISLDHDLQLLGGETDAGTGLEVAEFLSRHKPICPVILHTSNFDGRLSMHNKLRAGGWTVSTVAPREVDWIQTAWLPIARRLVGLPKSG